MKNHVLSSNSRALDRRRPRTKPDGPLDLSRRLARASTRAGMELLQLSAARTTKLARNTVGAQTGKQRSPAGSARKRSEGCTEQEAAAWIAVLERADALYRWERGRPSEAGWIQWNKFFDEHRSYRQKRQLTRELYLAKKQLGDDLFEKALVSIGASKTARLRRYRSAKRTAGAADEARSSMEARAQLEQMLEHGVILRRGEPRRLLREFPLNQFLALIRLAGGQRAVADGGREFRWPESLMSRTRALLTDWKELKGASAAYSAYVARQRDDAVRAEQMDFLRRLHTVLDEASSKLARWLRSSRGSRKKLKGQA